MSTLEDLAAERKALDSRLREAVVSAVAAGESVASVARRAGITRPTVYAWVKAATPDDSEALEARLAVLDARWDALVRNVVQRDMPAGQVSRRGNVRSGLQVEAMGRKVSRGAESASAMAVRVATDKLLAFFADYRGEDPAVLAIRDELDEAWKIRQTLAERRDAGCGF